MPSPAVMPAPHSLAAVPGFWQVVVPPGATFQPWLESNWAAALVENGNGLLATSTLSSGLGGDTVVVEALGADLVDLRRVLGRQVADRDARRAGRTDLVENRRVAGERQL